MRAGDRLARPEMKTTLLLVGIALLAACQQPVEYAPAPPPAVLTMEIGSAEVGGLRQLPARIKASQRAELSFRVAGRMQLLEVAEGDQVKQGALLAQLAQQDFKTVLADREAAYKRAQADYQRAQELIGDGYITRRDFDQIESRYKKTRAALGQARADLDYTALRAPFAGVVAVRHVENYEEVVLGQTVISLRSSDMVDVKFDVPESLIILVEQQGEKQPAQDNVVVSARFSAAPGVEYPLSFKEIAKKADPLTKTFEVTYLMPAPEEFNVLPGMTASVTINMPSLRGAIFLVPARAVIGDIAMEPRIWLLDPATMTVSSKAVSVGRLTGDSIEIVDGLEPGDVLVTSPSNFLLEGQRVEPASSPSLDATAAESA
jgi:RND family efflux transporter MFP subunit